jgi:predicted SAM-dependent methyltransferase
MIKLHLGCGKRDFGTDWTHIDGGDFPHLYSHNITKLSFRDNEVDLIYSSHTLEYFNREEVIDILREWKRVLKVGGVLRLAVPDFAAMVDLYLNSKDYELDSFLGPLYGKIQMRNTTIYHKTTYDFVSLKKVLENVGFTEVSRYNWRETDHSTFDDFSQAYLPHMDKENGTLISLNVECIKI